MTQVSKTYGTVAEAVHYSSITRTALYEALRRGDLSAKKAGRRTLISFAELDAYIANLPAYGQAA